MIVAKVRPDSGHRRWIVGRERSIGRDERSQDDDFDGV